MAVGQAVGDEEDRDKVLVKGRVCEETVVVTSLENTSNKGEWREK